MQLALHATRLTPHGASSLVLAMSAWPVKTRRAPSRHCIDTRVYGHTASAMHGNEYPPRSVGRCGDLASDLRRHAVLTPLRLQSRCGDKTLGIRVIYSHLSGQRVVVRCFYVFLGGAFPLRLEVAMSAGKGGASSFRRFWL